MVIGRFGWKANAPNLEQQIAAAFDGDMVITSSLFPDKTCTSVETECRRAPVDRTPQLTTEQLDAVRLYVAALDVPRRRDVEMPEVRRGEALFSTIGCAMCHRPDLQTGSDPDVPELARQIIHPYPDLLLHDMGPGLADGRPDFAASGRKWRTPPLWGLGLARTVVARAGLLHAGAIVRCRRRSAGMSW